MNKFDLVKVCDNDHEWLVELHNDPLVLHNITNPSPITLENHIMWWKNLNTNKERRFIFTVDKIRAGFVKIYTIDNINNNCMLGADLHSDFRGQGLASIMWIKLLEYCFDKLQLWRVGLTVAEYNHIAIKVYKNVGFIQEGSLIQSLYRNGKYHNQLTMYQTKDMYANFSKNL